MSDTTQAKNVFYQNFTVDWISATFTPYHGNKFAKQLGFKGWASDVEGQKPHGYNQSRELETGAIIAWHTDRKDMGLHVQLSGSTLRYYSTIGVDWFQMLTWIKKFEGRTSRVDLAIDLHNSGLTLLDFSEDNLKPYKGKGRTPKFVPMGTQKSGFTVYIGSRSSAKMLRIYDKAKEQKDANSDYIRVELECKKEIAHAIGWEFPTLGQSACVEMAQTLIRNVADFDLANWDIAMLSRDVGLSIPQGKEKDTLGWLIKICAPALARQIAKNPKIDVMGEFATALRNELQLRGLDIQ